MIIIDSREPADYQKYGDRVSFMQYGDATIIINEMVIRIERKTPSDMMNSIMSRRFGEQLANVNELHIVDEDKWLPKGVFEEMYQNEAFLKAVNTISERIPVKFFNSKDSYGRGLRAIEEKLRTNTYATIRVHARIDKNYSSLEVGFIAGILGIDEVLAKRIIDTYQTPMNAIINMPTWNLHVEGVGKKKIDQAVKFMLGIKEAKP